MASEVRKLRKKLNQYLSGKLTLKDFQDWFWSSLPEGEELPGEAEDVMLILSEFARGHRTEEEIKARFGALV